MNSTGANAAPRPAAPFTEGGAGRRRGESVGSNGRYVVFCCKAAGRAAASAGAAGRTGEATGAERRTGRGRSREGPKGPTSRRLMTVGRLIGGDAVTSVERQHGRQRAAIDRVGAAAAAGAD